MTHKKLNGKFVILEGATEGYPIELRYLDGNTTYSSEKKKAAKKAAKKALKEYMEELASYGDTDFTSDPDEGWSFPFYICEVKASVLPCPYKPKASIKMKEHSP